MTNKTNDGKSQIEGLGPQSAPNDYRIANRPGNPNWRGVSDWFERAAGLRWHNSRTPYPSAMWERPLLVDWITE